MSELHCLPQILCIMSSTSSTSALRVLERSEILRTLVNLYCWTDEHFGSRNRYQLTSHVIRGSGYLTLTAGLPSLFFLNSPPEFMAAHSTDSAVSFFPLELVDLIISIVADSCRTDNWAERAWLVQLAQVSRFASQTAMPILYATVKIADFDAARAFNHNLRSKEPSFGAMYVKAISFYSRRRSTDIRQKWLTIAHAIIDLCPSAMIQLPLVALPGFQRVFPSLENSTPNSGSNIIRSMSVHCANGTPNLQSDAVLQFSLSHLHLAIGAALDTFATNPASYWSGILSTGNPPGVIPKPCPITHIVIELQIDATVLTIGGHLARQLLNLQGQASNIGRPLQRLVFRVMESDPGLPHFAQILRDLQDERVALHVLQTSVYGLPQGRLLEIAQHGVFLHSVGLENLWTSGEQVWHPQ